MGPLRKAGIVLLVFVLLIVVLLVVIAVALPSEAANEQVARRISRTVLWGGGEVETALTVVPHLAERCRGQARSLDIVLLVDVSASMEGRPLRQAVAAADRFIQTVDLTRHRLALLLFAEEPVALQPLTDQRAPLQALLAEASAGGGTAPDLALGAARRELIGARAEAARLILLLSDGGTDDPASARGEAERARQENISIAVVGLLGDDFNETLLRDLALAGYYRLAQSPDDLVSIYTDLGNQVNQVVASDVVVREPVNQALRVIPASVDPPAVTSSAGLEWHMAWLTATSTPVFAYRVMVRDVGLYPVVVDGGAIGMRDCMGDWLNLETPLGPNILVMPPLPLIALLLGLLGLLGLVFLAFGRRREPRPKVSPVPPLAPEPVPVPSAAPARGFLLDPTPPEQAFRQWVVEATPLAVESQEVAPRWLRERPALFIGLGIAGEKVLADIATYLRGRCGPHWATRARHIRLLHITVSQDDREETRIRQTNLGFPQVILGLGREQKNRLSWHRGMQWFDRACLSNPGRALGRLAVFADLVEGKAESRLWSALQACVGDLVDASVYIIADAFSDEASGMIADIAHLLKVGRPRQVARVFLGLALQNADWQNIPSAPRRNERTFATLRELQRLQRRSPVEWIYAPGLGQPELEARSLEPLFDEILLFDGRGEGERDVSGWAAEDALLPCMAECFIALLDKETSKAFYDIGMNQSSQPLRKGQVPLEFVVGSAGCYALRLPWEEMSRIVGARLLHKMLFDRETGIIGWEELDEKGCVCRRGEVVTPAVHPSHIEEFLSQCRLSRETAARLSGDDVYRYVCPYLEQVLNPPGPTRLRWAKEFIAALKGEIPAWADDLDRIERSLQEWLSAAGELGRPKETAEDLWASLLAPESKSRVQEQFRPGPLYQVWQQEWLESRQILDAAGHMHARRLFWKLEDEGQLFETYIAPNRPWERMRGRIRWKWSVHGIPRLHLVVLPNDLGADDPENRNRTIRDAILQDPLSRFAYPVREPAQLLAALKEVAQAFSQYLPLAFQERLREMDSELAEELRKKAAPLCRRRKLDPDKWPIPVESFWYFAGPSIEAVEAIAEKLRTEVGKDLETHHFHRLTTSSDDTECRLLHVKYVLAIYAADAYAMARSSYTPKPELHVWEEEKAIVDWENKGRRKVSPRLRERKIEEGGSGISFSPLFVELLARHEGAMRLLGQLFVYGILRIQVEKVEEKKEILTVSATDDALADLRGKRVTEAVNTFLDLLAASPRLAGDLSGSVARHRPSAYEKKTELLDRVSEEQIRPLSERAEVEAQDVALLMAATAVDEERSD